MFNVDVIDRDKSLLLLFDLSHVQNAYEMEDVGPKYCDRSRKESKVSRITDGP